MSKTNSAIVIGSGIAGLATAARLQAQSWQVTVYEANEHAGGKVSVVGGEGYRFDAGPSLFTLPHLLEEVVRDCGKEPRDYFDYYRKEVACRYFWDDGTELTAYGDGQRFAREVEQNLDVPARRVIDHLETARRIYHYTTPVFLEKSLHRWQSFLNGETLRALGQMHRLHLHRSLHEVNQNALQHPKLVQLFDRFATYNGSSPYLTPGVMSSIPHLEHNVGTYYPRGGMHSITQTLYRLARDLGVEFHFGQRVESIITRDGRAAGVRLAHREHEAARVISNMDVVPTYRRLLPREKAPEKILRQPRSSSALIFYWGIAKAFPQLDLHNIFFSANYREEFAAIFERGEVYQDPTVYVNISSVEEPTDAPPGGQNWFVMINVPGDTGQNWDQLIAQVRQNTLAKLNRRLGCQLEDLIAYEEILDPRKIERDTGSFQGSLYGASSNNTMAAFLRHPNFSGKIKDLYFCGGSVHPGGGIPLCLLSGRITAGLIGTAPTGQEAKRDFP